MLGGCDEKKTYIMTFDAVKDYVDIRLGKEPIGEYYQYFLQTHTGYWRIINKEDVLDQIDGFIKLKEVWNSSMHEFEEKWISLERVIFYRNFARIKKEKEEVELKDYSEIIGKED
jgi:hypothetical protein